MIEANNKCVGGVVHIIINIKKNLVPSLMLDVFKVVLYVEGIRSITWKKKRKAFSANLLVRCTHILQWKKYGLFVNEFILYIV